MGSTRKAFDEVKAILGKLDRSIDEARTKRLGPDETEMPAGDATVGRAEPSGSTVIGGAAAPTPRAPVPGQTAQRSRAPQYGRARPLRRDGVADEAPPPTGQWEHATPAKPAKPACDDDTVIG